MFVSTKGRPQRWFERAARARDLAGALVEADALRPLGLPYALALVVLMGETRDARFDRAAVRWVARLTLERSTVGVADVRAAVAALEALADEPRAAREALTALCEGHGLPQVARLLVSSTTSAPGEPPLPGG